MLYYDYFYFIKQIYQFEKKKIKRILMILSSASFSIYFIMFANEFLAKKLNDSSHFLLTPVNEQVIINQSYLKVLSNQFKNTKIETLDNYETIALYNLTNHKTYDFSVQYDENVAVPVFNSEIFQLHEFKKGTRFKLNSLSFNQYGFDDSLSVDLILPSFYRDSKHDYGKILKIKTDDSIHKIMNTLNYPQVMYELNPIKEEEFMQDILNLINKFLIAISFIIFTVSSTNISSILPYFISEFEAEIILFTHMGLKKEIIQRLFLLLIISMILFSITLPLISCIILSLIVEVSLNYFKIIIIICLQFGFSLLISYHAIDI